MLGYGAMNSHPDIFCFSTTRHGGVGSGNYASFNCTHYCGDTPDNVRHNREILLNHLPYGTRLIIPHQTHGVEVAVVTEKTTDEQLDGIDAMVTSQRGICLCISTADCVPLMFYDRRRKVIAAAHAGWRGTLNRIAIRTLERMKSEFGTEYRDISVCIGPSISLASFEVGNEVYEAFSHAGFNMGRISKFNNTSGKWHIDLWEANRLPLIEHGVAKDAIETAGICTYINHEDFFSARRLGVKSGRILNGILIK